MIHDKTWPPRGGAYLPYISNLKKSSCQKRLDWFQYNLAEMFPWRSTTKIVQSVMICQKTWPLGGWGLFSLYIYIENLKKSSCQKPLDRFQYKLAKMFPWWPFTKIVQAVMICQKNMAASGRGLFSLYIYKENLNDLVRNDWTNFNIILQECFVCNPLSRLFKTFGFD